LELLEARQHATEVALWQFQQEGGGLFGNRGQRRGRQRLADAAYRDTAQAVQALVAPAFAPVEMARRMPQH